jgi:hypothetical protein
VVKRSSTSGIVKRSSTSGIVKRSSTSGIDVESDIGENTLLKVEREFSKSSIRFDPHGFI